MNRAIETGDKKLFVGEVVEAYADKAVAKGEKEVTYSGGTFPRKIYGTRFPPSPQTPNSKH